MFQFHDETKLRRVVGMVMICAGLIVLGAGPAIAGPPNLRVGRQVRPIVRRVPVPGGPQERGNRPSGETQADPGGGISQKGPGPFPPMWTFNLEVQQLGGGFEKWGNTMTVNSPENLRFRMRTLLPGTVSAQWQLADKLFQWSDPSGQSTGLIASGPAGPAPAKGKIGVFHIDLADYLPSSPPNSPATYYVRVVGQDANNQYAAKPSAWVTITYQKSGNWGQKFTVKGLGQTVKQKQPWMYLKSPMPIEIDLEELYVGNSNESADEPYLFVFVVYVDGTAIDLLYSASSHIRIDCPPKTHGNVPDTDKHGNDMETGKTANIPASTGHFEKTIVPIGYGLADDFEDADGSIGQGMKDYTSIYIVVVAMEEDNTSTSAADAARAAMLSKLQNAADATVKKLTLASLLHGEEPPDFDLAKLQSEMKEEAFDAAKDATLTSGWWTPLFAPVVLAEIVGPDDCVGYAYKEITLGQLLASGPGGISLNFNLANSSDWEGAYTVKGRIRRKN